ncbi:ATPase family protein associated with various cellular activities (AAA) [Nonomuraea polychroma]|uniref:ATPase family protein associated with various cellular activities (AAA) n=1 Tax=Nonomuraea polychroma TaxID=46176 RepID=A0A438M2E0_9ACTN|nr:ATP-binding protein [Nonomuraea polychroma]RVX39693.1 ATPase family protein associated with various cellular activities (AAA) [Nonomuraea polychroma]
MEIDEARSLAQALKKLLHEAATMIDESRPTPELVARVTGHVGCALKDLVCVTQRFNGWEHAGLQRGVDAYLRARGGADWFGVSGQGREHNDTIDILSTAARGFEMYEIGAVDYATAAVGPDESVEVVNFGLVLTSAPDGSPIVVGLRGPSDRYVGEGCRVEVIAASRASATAAREEIERLTRRHDVLRGQILTFGVSEHMGNNLVSFLPRPSLAPEEVILPDGVLERIERHVVGIGRNAEALVARGQHLKRGLLLHGPPGTGKTHTVRYLMGRMPGVTVVVMAGTAVGAISEAAALARRLQPSIVVVEDVDLVAHDRRLSMEGSPLLFTLFDAMDGIGADADVTFVLTTNRAEVLEEALANRPGRVDLAVEVPRPDARCRAALLRLYGGDLLPEGDLEPLVSRTEGMTASFFKELLRRAVLAGLAADGSAERLSAEHLSQALEEMLRDHEALTRSLLGARDPMGPALDEMNGLLPE